MATIHFHQHTTATPEQFIAGLTKHGVPTQEAIERELVARFLADATSAGKLTVEQGIHLMIWASTRWVPCQAIDRGPGGAAAAPEAEQVSLEELTARVDRLHRLLHDPQPGLFTWNERVGKALAALSRVA